MKRISLTLIGWRQSSLGRRRFQNSTAPSGFEHALRKVGGVPYAPLWRQLDFFHAVHARTGSTWSAVMEFQRVGCALPIARSSTR